MTKANDADQSSDLHKAIDGITAAYEAAKAVAVGGPDPDESFRATTDLAAAMRTLADAASEARAATALEIMTVNRISLAQLARRIGVSKGRADQLIRAARRADVEAP